MRIHTCLSLHEYSLGGMHCPCFSYLQQNDPQKISCCMFMHPPPCGIHTELHVAYSTGKTRNYETEVLCPHLTVSMKRPPRSIDHSYYSKETGQKAGKNVPYLVKYSMKLQ